MKKYIRSISTYFWLILALISTTGCSKKYMNGTIYMGSGGGFAGTWREYQLKANGNLYFRENQSDSLLFLKTLDSSATKKVFKQYYKLNINSENLDAPGNMYYYIGKREGKFRNHKVTFGNPEAKGLSKDLYAYFEGFMNSVNDTLVTKANKKKTNNSKFKSIQAVEK